MAYTQPVIALDPQLVISGNSERLTDRIAYVGSNDANEAAVDKAAMNFVFIWAGQGDFLTEVDLVRAMAMMRSLFLFRSRARPMAPKPALQPIRRFVTGVLAVYNASLEEWPPQPHTRLQVAIPPLFVPPIGSLPVPTQQQLERMLQRAHELGWDEGRNLERPRWKQRRSLALAMATHARLGAASPLLAMEDGVIRAIAEMSLA